jgi:hypothetical protein
VVADPDFSAQTPGAPSFADSTGKTWTLAGDAAITDPVPVDVDGSITPVLTSVWWKSIRYPFLNRPVRVGDYPQIERQFRGALHSVQGRSLPVAVTDIRSGRAWTLTLVTRTLEQARDMDLVIMANQVMFLHVPRETVEHCERVSAVPGGYYTIGTSVQRRPIPGSQSYIWTLPLTEVAAPGPDIVGTTMTWGTVYNLYGTWEALLASNPTWLDLWAIVGSPEDLVVL